MADEAQRVAGTGEDEPLLGRPGDASQQDGKPIYHNFVIGTAVLAQAGVWVLAAVIWGAVFSNMTPNSRLFSAHPLLNSTALLFLVQGILVLQPTHTAQQKKQGTLVHAGLNDVGFLAGVAGLIIIEYNKFSHQGTHFVSTHAILGLITYIFVVIQTVVGITQYFTPGLYGGVDNAKKLYKYHRLSGYIVLLLMLATVCAATQTDFNKQSLKIQLWAVVLCSVLIVIGVVARLKTYKLGWMAGK
ncbi:hypothetical protein AMS68_005312 [Peltaster fructicola]|uniref:Cytochrome b561 domain-containing protein n=1 Tax=Peltaster fructicola TaxID=286661 RepID=A0A6H0XYQ1_9PEZI|nr:hypothetical protein AMS68_005312 [Peltaster fructicola]